MFAGQEGFSFPQKKTKNEAKDWALPVDAALHENETELGVAVLPVAVQMLAHGHGLLDELVQILGDGGGEA